MVPPNHETASYSRKTQEMPVHESVHELRQWAAIPGSDDRVRACIYGTFPSSPVYLTTLRIKSLQVSSPAERARVETAEGPGIIDSRTFAPCGDGC
jgi:hypothetical protein